MIGKRQFIKVGSAAVSLWAMGYGVQAIAAPPHSTYYSVLNRPVNPSELIWTYPVQKAILLGACDELFGDTVGGFVHHSAGLDSSVPLLAEHLQIRKQLRQVFAGGCHPSTVLGNGLQILGASCHRDGQIKGFIAARGPASVAAAALLHNRSGRHGLSDYRTQLRRMNVPSLGAKTSVERSAVGRADKSKRPQGFWTLTLFFPRRTGVDPITKEALIRHVKSLYLEANSALPPRMRTYKFALEVALV